MIKKIKRGICIFVLFTFVLQVPGYAQISLDQVKSVAPELIKELSEKNKTESAPAPVKKEIAPQQKTSIEESELSQIEKLMAGTQDEKEQSLEQFGYSVFQGGPSSFAPAENQTVGPEYVIGPGDSFTVILWGISEGSFQLTVDKEGKITLPKAGVMGVAGLRYGELKNFLTRVLDPYYQNINLNVSMAKLRSIRIYVLGEVNRPGSYLVTSLTGVFNALYACGGPTKMGTLRKIKLIRRGKTIATTDIYDFLLNGNKSGDMLLEDGDTIFVPLIGKVVGIAGNVYRPAIYEINDGASLKDIFYVAGGLMPISYLNRVQIQRVVANEYRTVLDIDVAKEQMQNQNLPLKNMDAVRVFPIYSVVSDVVFLEGAVKQPGTYQLKPGIKVKDLIASEESLVLDYYRKQAELVSVDPINGDKKVRPVNLKELFAGDESQNYRLKPLDRLIVHTEKKEELSVMISGEVKVPGDFAIEDGEKLSSLIERAGGFTDKAYLFGAVFTRRSALANQQSSLNKLTDELERRILSESSMKLNNPEEELIVQQRYARSKDLLGKLKETQAKGRIIVKMDTPERLKETANDIVLEDGDSITIPRIP
ncbi:MAG: SLBB domain-containing protein, partial [bacterium]